jgi:hypothetical protein
MPGNNNMVTITPKGHWLYNLVKTNNYLSDWFHLNDGDGDDDDDKNNDDDNNDNGDDDNNDNDDNDNNNNDDSKNINDDDNNDYDIQKILQTHWVLWIQFL